MAKDARGDKEDGSGVMTLRKIGIKVPNIEVKGNKAVVKRKRYDVSTELKKRHSPKTTFRKISKESAS
jgi:hypothetical protein